MKKNPNDVAAPVHAGGKHLQKQMLVITCVFYATNHKNCVVKLFYTRWNFLNCLGALDGKHIIMTAPAKSGNLFSIIKAVFWLT